MVDQLNPSLFGILLGCTELLEGSESLDVLGCEVSLGKRTIDSEENVLEVDVTSVVIDSKQDVLKELLLGNYSIVKVVQHMEQEKVGDFVDDHLLDRLLHALEYNFPVFGVEYVK